MYKSFKSKIKYKKKHQQLNIARSKNEKEEAAATAVKAEKIA